MERQLLEQLYHQHYGAALLYTLALCRDKSLAEDIVADAFVKAYISLPKDSPSFPFWLFRVCKNLWIDHLRKNKYLSDTPFENTTLVQDTPEAAFLENERHRALWRAIHALSPPDRELVTLHYFSGLSLQEIAQALNKSYPAVRQRLHRLRLTIKQRMEEEGYDV